MAHDVFISYSTKDKTIADTVCAKLEENKIRVWIAPRDVSAGSNFAESIIRAINSCKVFVLIWSANTNTSNHILNEINQAFDHGITIIPFRIQDIQPTDEMRYYLGRTHWLDAITPPLEDHIATLKDTILANLGLEIHPPPPTPQLEQSPEEVSKLPDEPSVVKKPTIEEAEAVKPPVLSPHLLQGQKVDQEIQPTVVAPARLIRFIPIAAGALVVLTLLVLLVSGVFKGSPTAEIAEVLPSTTETFTPAEIVLLTSTSRPILTATPIPAWVNGISDPILAAINDSPPDFADDFSQVDPGWLYTQHEVAHQELLCSNTVEAKMSITDGSMKCEVDPNCQQGILTHQDIQYVNFVMQADFNLEQTQGTIELEFFYPSDINIYISFDSSGDWSSSLIADDHIQRRLEGSTNIDLSKPATVTIINKSPTLLIYINSVLLVSYNDIEMGIGLVNMCFNMYNDDPKMAETETFELDNIKVWDLEEIEITDSS